MNHLLISTFQAIPSSLRELFPEILLATAILLGCVLEWSTDAAGKRLVVWFCAISALATLTLSLVTGAASDPRLTGGMFTPDSITQFVRIFALSGAVLALLALNGSKAMDGRDEQGETALLILSVALGAILFASARHLLALYLGLEFLSLSSYGLAGFRARDRGASEAGLKYVLYGGVASAVALFGISHLWGITGSFDIGEIGMALYAQPRVVLVPLLLVSVAFAFKAGLAPFHFWSPDVYQGCPTVNAGFLSTVPKAAAFAAFLRTMPYLLPPHALGIAPGAIGGFLVIAGCLSIAMGSATALVQKDAKRILAFSSTANAGILVLALSTWLTSDAVAALAFYLVAYLLSNLGAFLALDQLERSSGSTSLAALAGSWKRQPMAVVALSICVFSLAGIPPLAGFVGKWAVLMEVVRAGVENGEGPLPLVGVAVALVGSVVLAAAYLRILRSAVVDSPTTDPGEDDFRPAALSGIPLLLCAIGSLALGLCWPLLSVFRSRLGG
ncbi:MAG TPA: NADH-quinone oxidoreductase subunit N [Fibrobacteria bacterium]|nr:NADH-quinone oxidoreductase subunit N [Fibrobacteria bacterium]